MNTSDDIARRAALLHAIAARADDLLHATDPPLQPQTTADRVTRLAASLGSVAATERDTLYAAPDELERHLLEHAADVLLWVEQLAREAAA